MVISFQWDLELLTKKIISSWTGRWQPRFKDVCKWDLKLWRSTSIHVHLRGRISLSISGLSTWPWRKINAKGKDKRRHRNAELNTSRHLHLHLQTSTYLHLCTQGQGQSTKDSQRHKLMVFRVWTMYAYTNIANVLKFNEAHCCLAMHIERTSNSLR